MDQQRADQLHGRHQHSACCRAVHTKRLCGAACVCPQRLLTVTLPHASGQNDHDNLGACMPPWFDARLALTRGGKLLVGPSPTAELIRIKRAEWEAASGPTNGRLKSWARLCCRAVVSLSPSLRTKGDTSALMARSLNVCRPRGVAGQRCDEAHATRCQSPTTASPPGAGGWLAWHAALKTAKGDAAVAALSCCTSPADVRSQRQ